VHHQLERLAREIVAFRKKDHLRRLGTALAIGQRLRKARLIVEPGAWNAWRRSQVRLSARSATNLLALDRLHSTRPTLFRKLRRLGLNKLYRIAELPEHFLRALTPQTAFRVPASGEQKSIESMSPVELNCCVREWTTRTGRKRPNQMAAAAVHTAEKLKQQIEDLLPRTLLLRPANRKLLRSCFLGVLQAIHACTSRLNRAEPAA